MENSQRIGQIMQALQMREEGDYIPGTMMRATTSTITGEARTALIAELVRLLTVA